MKEYLQETEYCNWSHRVVLDTIGDVVGSEKDDTQKARKVFYWVRDKISYRVGLWNRKASETLIEASGTCTNKSNLMVAMLRAIKIPAGFHVLKVKGKEYFGPIVPPMLKKSISGQSTHVHVTAFVNERWVKVDPSDDKEFSTKTSHLNPQSALVDWDGISDALLNLDPAHILDEQGPLANIDHIIRKKPATGKGVTIHVANLYIKFLREEGDNISNRFDLEPLFRKWLKSNSLLRYYQYDILARIRGVVEKIKVVKNSKTQNE